MKGGDTLGSQPAALKDITRRVRSGHEAAVLYSEAKAKPRRGEVEKAVQMMEDEARVVRWTAWA